MAEAEIPTDKLLVKSEHDILQLAEIPHEIASTALGPGKNFMVPIEHEQKVKDIGARYFTPEQTLLYK